jgi:hypothetical protein
MPAKPLAESDLMEALELVALYGTITNAAAATGMARGTLQTRYTKARSVFEGRVRRIASHHARMAAAVENGTVIVFSDAHYWPGAVSTAHRALLEAIKEFRPRIIVANGDVFDGATISRHPRIGWDRAPTVRGELQAVEERLNEIEALAGRAELVWPLGNHDSRFETFLAANAPQYEGVSGFALKDRFPRWAPCWRLEINAGEDSHTIVKHRMQGGIHAARNNTVKAGVNTVTGHLHQLKYAAVSDARGTRYGIDTGTLAELPGEQFVNYLEDGITDWRSGFAILNYRRGRLMQPEFVQVAAPGLVEFRGRDYHV